jgi:hypothetical protein
MGSVDGRGEQRSIVDANEADYEGPLVGRERYLEMKSIIEGKKYILHIYIYI